MNSKNIQKLKNVKAPSKCSSENLESEIITKLSIVIFYKNVETSLIKYIWLVAKHLEMFSMALKIGNCMLI